jgi:hypothetical protein
VDWHGHGDEAGVGGSGWRRKLECGVNWHGHGDGVGVGGLRRRNKVGVWGGSAWTWRWSGIRWVETEKKSWSVEWISMDMELKRE